MRQCPTCGEQFTGELRYCPLDGVALQQEPDQESTTVDPLIGEVLQGQFRLLERIGCGSSGNVYRAHQLGVERVVAVKVLHQDAARSPEFSARFTQEARAAAHLNHPNIITVFNVGHTRSGLPFMAMEWVEGVPLGKAPHALECQGTDEVVALAKQIASALVVAHSAGVIHRDLKPANILVSRAHGQAVVKVLDFGIAKVLGGGPIAVNSNLTRQGVVYGTPQYLSPEQAGGSEVDERSDLYSLGVILYELLTGRLPFCSQGVALLVDHLQTAAPDIGSIAPSLSDELAGIVMDLLAKSPDERPQSAAVLLARLHALANQRSSASRVSHAPPPHVHPSTTASELPAIQSQKRSRVSILAALVAMGLLVFGSGQLVAARSAAIGSAKVVAADNQERSDAAGPSGPKRALMVAADGYALRVLMPEEVHAEREEHMVVEIWGPDGSTFEAAALVLVFVDASGMEQGVSVRQSATPGRYVFARRFAQPGSYSMRILPDLENVDLSVRFDVVQAAPYPNS